MMSGYNTQNPPESSPRMQQATNSPIGVFDNEIFLNNGRFDNFLHHQQDRPSNVAHLIESAGVPGNVNVDRSRCPVTFPGTVFSQPFYHGINLMCPIMMLKKPANFQKDTINDGADVRHQNSQVDEASYGQHNLECDQTVISAECAKAAINTARDKAVVFTECGTNVPFDLGAASKQERFPCSQTDVTYMVPFEQDNSSGIRPFCQVGCIPNFDQGVGSAGDYSQQQPMAGSFQQVINIRRQEKENIKSLLLPGYVVQVCGAPMVGKSTIVRQAVDEVACRLQHQKVIQHHVTCKKATSFQKFLNLVAQKFSTTHSPDEDTVLSTVHSVLQQNSQCHHILVFHKCENLQNNPFGRQFLDFLNRILCDHVSVTIVFTTYKLFRTSPHETVRLIKIDVLSITDIITLLQHYVPGIDYVTYANVLVKTFCFPEAIMQVVEEYLADESCRVSPERLEENINNDQEFLFRLLDHRVQEVEPWVLRKNLFFLTHFGHSINNSFTEAHLVYTNSLDQDEDNSKRTICYLKCNHVVRPLPGSNRLVIHPLVVYYSMASKEDKQLLPQKWFDNTSNMFTHFLGRILLSAEASLQEKGRKGLIYGGLFQEWPNVRYLIQMALSCNINTYENFLKVGFLASGFILRIFPKEAESFYWALYKSAGEYGSPCDFAVVEAMLGQAVVEGSGTNKGKYDSGNFGTLPLKPLGYLLLASSVIVS